jgi:hypothetical protein
VWVVSVGLHIMKVTIVTVGTSASADNSSFSGLIHGALSGQLFLFIAMGRNLLNAKVDKIHLKMLVIIIIIATYNTQAHPLNNTNISKVFITRRSITCGRHYYYLSALSMHPCIDLAL